MSRETHRRYLESSARRGARRALERNPEVSRDELRSLKVQTIEPWKRVVAGLLSVSLSVTGGWLAKSDQRVIGLCMLGVGVLGFLFSIFGWRKTLDGLSSAIDIGDILDGLF